MELDLTNLFQGGLFDKPVERPGSEFNQPLRLDLDLSTFPHTENAIKSEPRESPPLFKLISDPFELDPHPSEENDPPLNEEDQQSLAIPQNQHPMRRHVRIGPLRRRQLPFRLQAMRCGLRLPKAVNKAAKQAAYNLRNKRKAPIRKHPSYLWFSYMSPRLSDGKIDALVFYRDLNKSQRKQQGQATVIPQEIFQTDLGSIASSLKEFGFDHVEYII